MVSRGEWGVTDKYGIFSTAVHPGIILTTDLGRHHSDKTKEGIKKMLDSGNFQGKSQGAGAATSLVAALDPKLAEGGVRASKEGKENWGVYLDNCQISAKAKELAVSSAEAEKLWKLSEELTGEKFAW